jgi:dolichol-phosphate mannosyltransferase
MSALEAALGAVAIAQAALAGGALARMARTARGRRVADAPAPPGTRITVLVPVRDEERRIDACLASLVATGSEVREILVVDGGSRDATAARVARWRARDGRVRWIDAGPPPPDWNGKAFGLHVGVEQASPETEWLLGLDADVRIRPTLPGALVAHATAESVAALSAAVRQRLPSRAQALLHPAMLTTLVVRFGIPGHATRDPARVQANGQCWLARADLIAALRPFAAVRDSLCEDVSAARHLARHGVSVGFYEIGDLAEVRMYESAAALWREWPRSLPLRDAGRDPRVVRGWLEIAALQGAVIPMGAAAAAASAELALAVIGALAAARVGILAGTARAYVERGFAYWLSPLADPAVVARILVSAVRRRHRWRGRIYERTPGGGFRAAEEER